MYFRELRNIGTSNLAEYIIDNAQPSDSGTYACIAQNTASPVEDRVQVIVSEDGNDISGGGSEEPPTTTEEENKTSGPTRGDIAGGDENTGVISNAKPEDDLVNIVGSRAVFTCNAGMFNMFPHYFHICTNFIGLGATASRDRISLTWTRGNNLPLSEEHDISDNMLILRNVQKQDQGVYNCVGYGSSGIVFSRSVTLKVVGKFILPIKYHNKI